MPRSYGEKKEKLEFIHTQMDEMDSRLGKLYDALETGDFKNGELAPRMRGLSQKKEELLQVKANPFSSIPFLPLVKAAQMQYGALSQSQVFRHFQWHLKTAGRFNNDADGFQSSDVLAGISNAFMVIGKLTYTFGTTERHVQGILSNISVITHRQFMSINGLRKIGIAPSLSNFLFVSLIAYAVRPMMGIWLTGCCQW